jgi:hypothetical protein
LFEKLDLETYELESQLELGVVSPNGIPFQLLKDLDKLHEEILEIKQYIGLGIIIKKESTEREKVNSALGL